MVNDGVLTVDPLYLFVFVLLLMVDVCPFLSFCQYTAVADGVPDTVHTRVIVFP
jgi:hypothetical protein